MSRPTISVIRESSSSKGLTTTDEGFINDDSMGSSNFLEINQNATENSIVTDLNSCVKYRVEKISINKAIFGWFEITPKMVFFISEGEFKPGND
mmetsp:Transcript_23873/g.3982  ORF Transcript_23873/g.3982 Transcript_23873/m.3982 type:complete len:94 (-) Transcript_23873:212-493(-)